MKKTGIKIPVPGKGDRVDNGNSPIIRGALAETGESIVAQSTGRQILFAVGR